MENLVLSKSQWDRTADEIHEFNLPPPTPADQSGWHRFPEASKQEHEEDGAIDQQILGDE